VERLRPSRLSGAGRGGSSPRALRPIARGMSKAQTPFDPKTVDIPELERGAKSLRFAFWFVSVFSYPFIIVLSAVLHVWIGVAILGVSWLVGVPFLRWALVQTPSQRLAEAREAQGVAAMSAFGG